MSSGNVKKKTLVEGHTILPTLITPLFPYEGHENTHCDNYIHR